jgi:hypothetical protein
MFDQAFIQQVAEKTAEIVLSRLKKQPTVQREYLTYEEVGQMIGRTKEGVRYLVKSGKLPICDEYGRVPRIHINDVRAYMESIKRWSA